MRLDARRRAVRAVLEATTGIEPVMEVLQTSALPLGYVAPEFRSVPPTCPCGGSERIGGG